MLSCHNELGLPGYTLSTSPRGFILFYQVPLRADWLHILLDHSSSTVLWMSEMCMDRRRRHHHYIRQLGGALRNVHAERRRPHGTGW